MSGNPEAFRVLDRFGSCLNEAVPKFVVRLKSFDGITSSKSPLPHKVSLLTTGTAF